MTRKLLDIPKNYYYYAICTGKNCTPAHKIGSLAAIFKTSRCNA